MSHEDQCMLQFKYPNSSKCKHENKDKYCTAKDSDLVSICVLCELNKVDPDDGEYCKGCLEDFNKNKES